MSGRAPSAWTLSISEVFRLALLGDTKALKGIYTLMSLKCSSPVILTHYPLNICS